MAGIAELIAKFEDKSGLYKEIFNGTSSIEDAVANAAKAGYTVTVAELTQAVVKVRGPEVLKLSDADLEQVVGGVMNEERMLCSCYGF